MNLLANIQNSAILQAALNNSLHIWCRHKKGVFWRFDKRRLRCRRRVPIRKWEWHACSPLLPRDNSLIAIHIWTRHSLRHSIKCSGHFFRTLDRIQPFLLRIPRSVTSLVRTSAIPFRRSCLTNQGDDETNPTIPIFAFQLFVGGLFLRLRLIDDCDKLGLRCRWTYYNIFYNISFSWDPWAQW